MPARRRHRGEDSSYRLCSDRHGCPPPEPPPSGVGKPKRPEHGRSCKAPWAYAVDRGMVGGKRVRHVVTASTKAALLEKVRALKEKQSLGVTPHAQTVADWLDYWLVRVAPAEGIRPSTLAGYRSKVDRYLKPSIGRVKLQDLRPEHVEGVEDWMRTLRKERNPGRADPLSDTTIRQAHMVLQSALAAALQRGKVVRNVAEVVKAPKAEERPHGHLQRADATAVLRAAVDERELCRLVVALALGLRQGEALGLRWNDYRRDADGYYLLVLESVQRIDGRLIRVDVKSRASHRRVPIPDRMVPTFEAWRARSTDAYLFPGPAGGPCDSKADWRAWRASLARAGVPMIPLHGARGSAASLLADMDVPDWRIAEILGHSQVAVTRKFYIEGTDAASRRAIDGLIGELLP